MLTVAPVTGAVGSPAGAEDEVLEAFEETTIFVLEETGVDEGEEVVTTELEVDDGRIEEEVEETVEETLGDLTDEEEGTTLEETTLDEEGLIEEEATDEDADDEAEEEAMELLAELLAEDDNLAEEADPVETGPELVELADADTEMLDEEALLLATEDAELGRIELEALVELAIPEELTFEGRADEDDDEADPLTLALAEGKADEIFIDADALADIEGSEDERVALGNIEEAELVALNPMIDEVLLTLFGRR
jgi:hypothetical protein